MPPGFPCPNPTCTQTFPPEAVKGVGSLKCPRCGTVYQFRAPSPAPVPPNPPPASKPAAARIPRPAPPPLPPRTAPPPPPPVVIAAPLAPLPAHDQALDFSANPDMMVKTTGDRKGRRRRGGGSIVGQIVFYSFLLLFIGVLAAGGFYLIWTYRAGKEAEEDNKTFKRKGNFRFVVNTEGWKKDSALARSLRVDLALTLKDPLSHVVLNYRDYQYRLPTDGELLDRALFILRKQVPLIEYKDPFIGPNKGRTGTLGEQPAIVLEFTFVDKNEVTMAGQAHMLGHRGIGYWFIAWGPKKDYDDLVGVWEQLREGFTILDDREGWTPRNRDSNHYANPQAGFQLDLFKDLWELEKEPKDFYDKAVAAFRAFEPDEDEDTGRKTTKKDPARMASVCVLVLEQTDSVIKATEVAQEYIKQQLVKTNPDLKIEPDKDKKGKPRIDSGVGALIGRVYHLNLKLDEEKEDYGVLAVVQLKGHTLAIICQCPGPRRVFWNSEFKALLETVREAK